MSTWEERMSERAKARRLNGDLFIAGGLYRAEPGDFGMFAAWVEPEDPADINPQIIAARCLGIQYGDPGPRLEPDLCRECYGERHVWLGNCWGVQHRGRNNSLSCQHSCHEGEVWLAATG